MNEIHEHEKITFTDVDGELNFFYGGRPVSNILAVIITFDLGEVYFRTSKREFKKNSPQIFDDVHDAVTRDYVILQPVINCLMTVEVRLSEVLKRMAERDNGHYVYAYHDSIEIK